MLAKNKSYKTLNAIADMVNTAKRAYAAAEVQGLVTPEQTARVIELDTRYRAAMRQAVVAARFNYSTAAPEDVALLATDLATLIASYVH